MVQHQVRGIIHVIDDCSFSVRNFDMLPASPAVTWWGAAGYDFDNMTRGFPVSSQTLTDAVYANDSFIVSLLPNITWDKIAILAIWDPPTESDFGHVIVKNGSLGDPDSDPSLSPAPAPGYFDSPAEGVRIDKQRTTFDNCKKLSDKYRLRWTLNLGGQESIDIGLEAAVGSQEYMAFGWGALNAESPSMLNADVAITGFTEDGMPMAEDYFISGYSECLLKNGKYQGVCPDMIYEDSDPAKSVNNTILVYGHRIDGVSFVRYNRPLVAVDTKYDVPISKKNAMTVIWALGLIRPSDSLHEYYLPQNHHGSRGERFGYLTLNVSEPWNDCVGPLDAENKEDQDLIFADKMTTLLVTTGPAMHYPNPPSPSKVLYINKKEAPRLKVERGVPVTFSIQAGHDVALYITSDPIGGNATLRNVSEVIYAGGVEYEGVPADPTDLIWLPDRNTPDQVYYHSLFGEKMGWKIQVVDGGLSDMYNNSVLLDDQQVTFFWTLSDDSISIAARGEKKSGYLAIGFGGAMVNSFAYVGWIDNDGKPRVSSYWIDGKDALSLHPTQENLTDVRCSIENGIVTLEFTRPLLPLCSGRLECKNIIDSNTPLRLIWAMGAQWSEGPLSEKNMHSATSNRPVRVMLMRGSAEAEQDLRPVLAVHGFMMFVAWGILLPGGILAARYLKHVKGDGWYRIHAYLQYSGISIVFLGVLFAAAELRGFFLSSIHVKFGVTAIVLACIQPVNACLRPKKASNNESSSIKRIIWEYFHIITGRSAIIVGLVSLITGLKHLGDRYDDENIQGLLWALILWFVVGAAIVLYLEYSEVKRRSKASNSFKGTWVLGNDENDSTDLLESIRTSTDGESHMLGTMEVELEPIHR